MTKRICGYIGVLTVLPVTLLLLISGGVGSPLVLLLPLLLLLLVVRGLAPETQVGLSGYSATIKLRDDSGWRLCVLTDAWSDPRTAVDDCLRFYLNPDRWFAMNRLRTSVICVTSDAAPALSPESTFFIEYCAGGPSSATPVLLSCVASFDTAPPPQDLLAGLLYTAPPPSTGDGSFDSYLSSP
ncbi:uncharacterized protein UHOD_11563 [Ustilago sp. UG-2017b]|nr:uncharacterized protein UHOD_11563 [Ustilago sp. UG-2017b]